MKTMRSEWRKELRRIHARKRAISREDHRDEKAMQKRIAAERKAFDRLTRGRSKELFRLHKRTRILEGRLSS